MDSNSIISATNRIASKEFGNKKKRSHRSAKLKQCKLDARREQWLSHARNKGCRGDVNGVVVGAMGLGVKDSGNKSDQHQLKDLEMRRQRCDQRYGPIQRDSDSESPADSPGSSVSGGNGEGNSYSGISSSRSSQCSSSSSSFGSGGCGSGDITEDEGGDNGCLDDWEAMADALAAVSIQDKPTHNQKTSPGREVLQSASKRELPDTSKGTLGAKGENPRSDIVATTESMPVADRRAWRPDDTCRPHGLPNLLKQNSFPMDSEKHSGCGLNPWSHKPIFPVPTCCPICCEDLDITDSSFLPCPCGFRLCLFCHKRIVEEDGRCPGCRKTYKLEIFEKEASVCGGSLTVGLARSCSMFSRT